MPLYPATPTYTPGSVLFAGSNGFPTQNNSGLFFNTTNGTLGIGTTIPLVAVHTFNNTVGFVNDLAVASGQGGGILVRKAGGTTANIFRVQSGWNVGIYNARGAFNDVDNSTTATYSSNNTGRFQFTASEDFTSTGQGSFFNLGLIAKGTTTVLNKFFIGKEISLTNNTVINILSLTTNSNRANGGILNYTVEIVDTGTPDIQIESGQLVWSVYNKGGTLVGTVTKVNAQQNLSAGTLTTTWAINVSANPAIITLNANSSLTPAAGYPYLMFNALNASRQDMVI